MTITEKILQLKDINIETLFDEVLKDNEAEILDMNRSQMYDEGVVDVNAPNKTEKYSPSTIRAKKRAPFPRTEFITLKNFGKFHAQLKLIILKDKFIISSDNLIWAKFLETQSRFKSALGLTEKSKGELREIARDDLINKIRSKL